jgi:BirA family biotin operon repressor/biotin-[acetyl-CoA-carboxylase] ligase
LGRRIRLELPDGDRHGEAVGIDGFGRLLVVDAAGGTTPYSSGEVVHLR